MVLSVAPLLVLLHFILVLRSGVPNPLKRNSTGIDLGLQAPDAAGKASSGRTMTAHRRDRHLLNNSGTSLNATTAERLHIISQLLGFSLHPAEGPLSPPSLIEFEKPWASTASSRPANLPQGEQKKYAIAAKWPAKANAPTIDRTLDFQQSLPQSQGYSFATNNISLGYPRSSVAHLLSVAERFADDLNRELNLWEVPTIIATRAKAPLRRLQRTSLGKRGGRPIRLIKPPLSVKQRRDRKRPKVDNTSEPLHQSREVNDTVPGVTLGEKDSAPSVNSTSVEEILTASTTRLVNEDRDEDDKIDGLLPGILNPYDEIDRIAEGEGDLLAGILTTERDLGVTSPTEGSATQLTATAITTKGHASPLNRENSLASVLNLDSGDGRSIAGGQPFGTVTPELTQTTNEILESETRGSSPSVAVQEALRLLSTAAESISTELEEEPEAPAVSTEMLIAAGLLPNLENRETTSPDVKSSQTRTKRSGKRTRLENWKPDMSSTVESQTSLAVASSLLSLTESEDAMAATSDTSTASGEILAHRQEALSSTSSASEALLPSTTQSATSPSAAGHNPTLTSKLGDGLWPHIPTLSEHLSVENELQAASTSSDPSSSPSATTKLAIVSTLGSNIIFGSEDDQTYSVPVTAAESSKQHPPPLSRQYSSKSSTRVSNKEDGRGTTIFVSEIAGPSQSSTPPAEEPDSSDQTTKPIKSGSIAFASIPNTHYLSVTTKLPTKVGAAALSKANISSDGSTLLSTTATPSSVEDDNSTIDVSVSDSLTLSIRITLPTAGDEKSSGVGVAVSDSRSSSTAKTYQTIDSNALLVTLEELSTITTQTTLLLNSTDIKPTGRKRRQTNRTAAFKSSSSTTPPVLSSSSSSQPTEAGVKSASTSTSSEETALPTSTSTSKPKATKRASKSKKQRTTTSAEEPFTSTVEMTSAKGETAGWSSSAPAVSIASEADTQTTAPDVPAEATYSEIDAEADTNRTSAGKRKRQPRVRSSTTSSASTGVEEERRTDSISTEAVSSSLFVETPKDGASTAEVVVTDVSTASEKSSGRTMAQRQKKSTTFTTTTTTTAAMPSSSLSDPVSTSQIVSHSETTAEAVANGPKARLPPPKRKPVSTSTSRTVSRPKEWSTSTRQPPPTKGAPIKGPSASKSKRSEGTGSGGLPTSQKLKRGDSGGGGSTSEPELKIRKIDKPPLDILLEEPDLTTLAAALKQSELSKNADLKRIAATIFAPIDDAFESLPIDFTDASILSFPNQTDYGTAIFEYHIVAPRLVPPLMIPLDAEDPLRAPTRFNKRTLALSRTSEPSQLGDNTIRVDGYAEVVEIIQARRGWIYKVNSVLGPRWNNGPTALQFIRENPAFTKVRFLVEHTNIFSESTEHLGPITLILIPDSGWAMNGVTLPDCVFEALVRPENAMLLEDILKWLTIPGLWDKSTIARTHWLPSASPPQLRVAHVIDPMDFPVQKNTSDGKKASRRKTQDADVIVEHPIYYVQNPRPVLGNVTFIEDREVTVWDIPLYNGWAHVISALPMNERIEPLLALWDCVHEFCFECPKVADHLLTFFDNGGLIPSNRPLEYMVPPSPRPDWVCKGTSNWFPPGWRKRDWDRYIVHAKTNDRRAPREARAGAIHAAETLGELKFKLEDARIKLKRIKAFGSNFEHEHYRPLWDPSALISIVTARREFGGMPDCKQKDDPEDLTLNDLMYLSRWM